MGIRFGRSCGGLCRSITRRDSSPQRHRGHGEELLIEKEVSGMKKDKEYYISLNYPVQLEKVEEGFCVD